MFVSNKSSLRTKIYLISGHHPVEVDQEVREGGIDLHQVVAVVLDQGDHFLSIYLRWMTEFYFKILSNY